MADRGEEVIDPEEEKRLVREIAELDAAIAAQASARGTAQETVLEEGGQQQQYGVTGVLVAGAPTPGPPEQQNGELGMGKKPLLKRASDLTDVTPTSEERFLGRRMSMPLREFDVVQHAAAVEVAQGLKERLGISSRREKAED